MSKVALIIIYNHQYNKNIPVLEELYSGRFSNIYHLVPFYTGNNPRVIPVYENSFYFQGYVTQGLKFFFDERYEHYMFVADDLLLNPVINEYNYKQHFKLKADTCFVPELVNFHDAPSHRPWERVADAFYFNIDIKGAEAKSHFPSQLEAEAAFKRFDLPLQPLRFEQIWSKPRAFKDYFTMPRREVLRYIKNKILNQKHFLRYPLVGGYSDIFIVSADAIKQFSHYCGVTAVTQLFVEVGLPTSLVLSAKEIVTEKNLELKGITELDPEKYTPVIERFNYNLKALLTDFPAELLYIHPIKLSKWRN